MNIDTKGENNRVFDNVIVNYISNDEVSRFREVKKAPNSSRVRCNQH